MVTNSRSHDAWWWVEAVDYAEVAEGSGDDIENACYPGSITWETKYQW